MAAISKRSWRLTGSPLWVSEVEPGSVHDITAARIHALPALYQAAAAGLPALADPAHPDYRGVPTHGGATDRAVIAAFLARPADLPRTVRGRPLASAGVCGGWLSRPGARGASVTASPFLTARRTRRACFHATGSPRFLPLGAGYRGQGVGIWAPRQRYRIMGIAAMGRSSIPPR